MTTTTTTVELVNYEKLTLSKSRMRTAICARFAASATSVKSLRKGSVDADEPMWTGCGAAALVEGDCCVDDKDDVCVEVGEVMGAFMVGCLRSKRNDRKSEKTVERRKRQNQGKGRAVDKEDSPGSSAFGTRSDKPCAGSGQAVVSQCQG